MSKKKETTTDVQLQLVGDPPPSVSFTGVGLEFNEMTTFEDWQKVGVGMAKASNISSFCLGDWLNFGEKKFDKKQYKEAIAATGLKYGTLRNMASVAKRFTPEKRRQTLSFEHHRLLAPVKTDEKLAQLMDRAENEHLSANALKEIVPKAKAKKLTPEQQKKADDKADEKHRQNAELLIDYLSDMPTRFLAGWSQVLDRLVDVCETTAPLAASELAKVQAEAAKKPKAKGKKETETPAA